MFMLGSLAADVSKATKRRCLRGFALSVLFFGLAFGVYSHRGWVVFALIIAGCIAFGEMLLNGLRVATFLSRRYETESVGIMFLILGCLFWWVDRGRRLHEARIVEKGKMTPGVIEEATRIEIEGSLPFDRTETTYVLNVRFLDDSGNTTRQTFRVSEDFGTKHIEKFSATMREVIRDLHSTPQLHPRPVMFTETPEVPRKRGYSELGATLLPEPDGSYWRIRDDSVQVAFMPENPHMAVIPHSNQDYSAVREYAGLIVAICGSGILIHALVERFKSRKLRPPSADRVIEAFGPKIREMFPLDSESFFVDARRPEPAPPVPSPHPPQDREMDFFLIFPIKSDPDALKAIGKALRQWQSETPDSGSILGLQELLDGKVPYFRKSLIPLLPVHVREDPYVDGAMIRIKFPCDLAAVGSKLVALLESLNVVFVNPGFYRRMMR